MSIIAKKIAYGCVAEVGFAGVGAMAGITWLRITDGFSEDTASKTAAAVGALAGTFVGSLQVGFVRLRQHFFPIEDQSLRINYFFLPAELFAGLVIGSLGANSLTHSLGANISYVSFLGLSSVSTVYSLALGAGGFGAYKLYRHFVRQPGAIHHQIEGNGQMLRNVGPYAPAAVYWNQREGNIVLSLAPEGL
jgi:hypothetical protein